MLHIAENSITDTTESLELITFLTELSIDWILQYFRL